MRSVIVMPTLQRPEFLALSLEKISGARLAPQDVRIFLDFTGNQNRLSEIEYVRDFYFPTAEIFRAKSHIAAVSGTWNILHSLKQGYETGADFIFLIEEDVLIRPEFFEVHYGLHSTQRLFATCGRLLSRLSSSYYTNPGACFRRESLELIIPHICDRFFANRRAYLDEVFGEMDEASDLDDGLIRRVIRSVAGEVKYPARPICAHQGFHYYNKLLPYQTTGTIDERIAQLRIILSKLSPTDRYTKDFEPYESGNGKVETRSADARASVDG